MSRTEDLPVEPISDEQVEYGVDATGRLVYRHVLTTRWSTVPAP